MICIVHNKEVATVPLLSAFETRNDPEKRLRLHLLAEPPVIDCAYYRSSLPVSFISLSGIRIIII